MSLLVIEGFGGYGTGAHSSTGGDMMYARWVSPGASTTLTSLQSDSVGTRNYWSGSTGDNAMLDLGGSHSTLVVGFRVQFTGTQNGHLFSFFNGAGDLILGVVRRRDNRIAVTRGDGYEPATYDLAWTDGLTEDRWHYIEIKVVFHDTTGSVEIRHNGVTVASATNVDTQLNAGPCTGLYFMQNTLEYDWNTDQLLADIYVDTATFHGPMRIVYQQADSAGGTANFTPLASTNQSQVDEIGHDGDTSYNYSTSTGNFDRLTTSKSVGSEAPLAIQAMATAKTSTQGTEKLKVGIRSDPSGTPTESLSGTQGVVSGQYHPFLGPIEETDPDTAAAWTAANADAAEIVYNHSA